MTTATQNAAMNPTDADYEKLARTVVTARGDDPDEMRKDIGGVESPAWEWECIDGDDTCTTATRDTLDNFRRAAREDWREASAYQEINGGLFWSEVQAKKGDRRESLTVVDCGDFRLCYQV